MKFEFDEMEFKNQIELMNLQRQMEQNNIKSNQTIGFNLDDIYDQIDNQKIDLK